MNCDEHVLQTLSANEKKKAVELLSGIIRKEG